MEIVGDCREEVVVVAGMNPPKSKAEIDADIDL
jgi:hypothetical protein